MMHLKFPQAVLAAGLVALPVGSKVILFEDTSYIVYRQDKDTLSNASEESIRRNLQTIEQILGIIHTPGCKVCDPNTKHGIMKLRLGGPLGVRLRVRPHRSDTLYTAMYHWSFAFPVDTTVGLVKRFSVRTECVDASSRPLTVPESCSVKTQEYALRIAKSFLSRLLALHGQQLQVQAFYDTAWVSESFSGIYNVKIEATSKNDIIDTRRAAVMVNSETGRVDYYQGAVYSKFDLSYTPTISRAQAFEIMRSEVAKVTPTKPQVRSARLSRDDNGRWRWVFILRLDSDSSGFAPTLGIDSETGRIQFRHLD